MDADLCSFCCSLFAEKISDFNILELYSGIGGMRFAVEESGLTSLPLKLNFSAFDINTVANDVYSYNFGKNGVNQRNITSITAEEVDEMCVDLLTMSPPCQPFTRLGLQRDIYDRRTDSFVHFMIDVLPNMKSKPNYILIENVKGFEASEARNLAVSKLKENNYEIREFLLSPIQFGVPNSRLRYYLLAKKQKVTCQRSRFCFSADETIENDLPKLEMNDMCFECKRVYFNRNCFEFESNRIEQYLDLEITSDLRKAEEYMLTDAVLNKYSMIMDIVGYDSRRSCCFTRGYGQYVHGSGSVLKTNNDITVDKVYSQITKYDVNDCNELINERVQMLRQLKLRLFTPEEVKARRAQQAVKAVI